MGVSEHKLLDSDLADGTLRTIYFVFRQKMQLGDPLIWSVAMDCHFGNVLYLFTLNYISLHEEAFNTIIFQKTETLPVLK